ncbi:TIGR02594 family protein [Bradyrhizobium sp. Leo121]|uniref:NlpC/P60 family protein n=1 Tax=Bradyrhizobium sp. Leo121 TaxID=1571195 RepID=UPI001028BCFC|nr:TIGR02594 family protein [Bradyrhizobium sp. Leo121]RZN13907.1 hypothetical protein CWO90_43960 [Bradyrhizobium sp. Leo121]
MADRFRSLTGGYFSANPDDKSLPVTIRFNNPGAINGASWQHSYPGYVGEKETTPGNRSTIVASPEEGVAMWWELMRRYRSSNVVTMAQIINRYGGGQDYSRYLAQVRVWTKLPTSTEIKLYGDDDVLLGFAKAMFRYEAGRTLPWSDEQIRFGFDLARNHAAGKPQAAPAPATVPPPSSHPSVLQTILSAIGSYFLPKAAAAAEPPLKLTRVIKFGSSGDDVKAVQRRLIALGYNDVVVDGIFGPVCQAAVRKFQTACNLDPDGEVGDLTVMELNKGKRLGTLDPPLNQPPATATKPAWYAQAEKWIGWHETGENRGLETFIKGAHCGQEGDPWCAIFANYCLETSGFKGTKSAAARSFETHPEFTKLKLPALGCIVTMWRGSKSSGQGHVFLYDGENSSGVRGIGANEDDQVKRSIHDRSRIVGYYWPKSAPAPKEAVIAVGDNAGRATSEF